MKKIMFICTGNICRSAMAHALLESRLKEENINDVIVNSCGIYAQDGQEATYNAIVVIDKYYNVDLSKHKATNILNSNIKDVDIILCATKSHKEVIQNTYPELTNKVFTMKEYVKYDENNKDVDIQDPWGYNIEIYLNCATQISKCIERIIEELKK